MYLSSLHKITPDSSDPPVISVWFSKQPIGKNKLGDLAKTMSQKGGLSGRKVNHSARKTTVTSLLHSKVEATQIMQLTGHRNVQSINQYSSASLEQQETMSNILTDISCGNSGVSCNGNISSTSKQEDLQVPVIAKPSFDDDFPDVDFNEIVSDIENFENRNLVNPNTNPVHNQSTVIDLAPSCITKL